MDFSFKDFSWEYFGFENFAALSLALLVILFLLFEYFPGRNYFYSLNQLKKFVDKHLISHLIKGSESKKRSWIRIIIVSFIWLFLVVALANPRWDFESVESYKPNINLVILLDISKSMDAADEKPSRLERAKQEIVDIIKKSDLANIGIIAFANQAHIISPVTDDRNALMYLLPSVSTGLVGVQGSNIEAGLKSADLLLRSMGGGANYILVISDGGFEDEKDLKSLKNSVRNGKIISFGIGKTEGAPIPDKNGGFIKENDKTVLTKLEKENLIKLSGLEDYIQGSYRDDDTQKVISIITSQIDVAKSKSRLQKIWHDRFYIPLIIAALIILPFFRRGAMFPAILVMLFAGESFAQNMPEESAVKKRTTLEEVTTLMFKNDDQQAKDLYEERQYKEAAEKYSSDYNKGTSLFRDGDMKGAEDRFSVAAQNNIEAEYNLGNAQLLQDKIKEAIATYESVLKKSPKHEDAKINLEIAKKLQQNQNKSDNGDNKDKSQDQQGGGQGQNNKDTQSGKPDGGNGQNGNNAKDQQDNGQQGGGKEGGQQQQKKDGDSSGEDGDNSQESGGNMDKKELDIQAKSILSKISSDPEKLMKNRFKYEEGKSGGKAYNNKNPRPW